mmetsp:Transcript_10042/g.21040  ORF Transcript_10042/g.21040 Transcript_10042/m.21040 type:complete len:410 (+) Transcript_10042:182-1411(+)
MCCCCPSAISAIFCLWVQSGFSKGTVAGALTFFPPDPPLYKFKRFDKNGNPLPDASDGDDGDNDRGEAKEEETKREEDNRSNKNRKQQQTNDDSVEVVTNGNYKAKEGQTTEKVRSPAQQFTDQAKALKKRGVIRNARDARDASKGVTYELVLDPRLQPPQFRPHWSVTAHKIPTGKASSSSRSHCAATVVRVPSSATDAHASGGTKTRTIIFSHGNATDIGAMYPLQVILSNSLECNVVSYDYSGYGESGGVALEANTYTDIEAVFEWTLENLCDGDESRIILYGQSVGSGPCCHLAKQVDGLGGMVLHSPFMSGMRVLTPSRALACLDIYPNIDRMRKTKCPVMIIHGRLDEEVAINHGIAMYEAIPDHLKRDPWWVPDRGHNDITEGPGKLVEYIRRLRTFFGTLD